MHTSVWAIVVLVYSANAFDICAVSVESCCPMDPPCVWGGRGVPGRDGVVFGVIFSVVVVSENLRIYIRYVTFLNMHAVALFLALPCFS